MLQISSTQNNRNLSFGTSLKVINPDLTKRGFEKLSDFTFDQYMETAQALTDNGINDTLTIAFYKSEDGRSAYVTIDKYVTIQGQTLKPKRGDDGTTKYKMPLTRFFKDPATSLKKLYKTAQDLVKNDRMDRLMTLFKETYYTN
jgi:hypothetical protein